MKTLQAAHDSAHAMHDHTTALGVECEGMKGLAAKDCPTCDGTGQVTKDEKQMDCPACEGEGTIRAASNPEGINQYTGGGGHSDTDKHLREEARWEGKNGSTTPQSNDTVRAHVDGKEQTGKVTTSAPSGKFHNVQFSGGRSASFSSSDLTVVKTHDGRPRQREKIKTAESTGEGDPAIIQGAEIMTKEERASTITALAACSCSGHKGNMKALVEMSDETIAALDVARIANKATEDELKATLAATEEKLKAAEAAAIPAEELTALRALAEEKKAADAKQKAELVGQLKAAQKAYTEAELNELSLTALAKLAQVARVERPIDYSGRGVAVPRAASTDDFTPPNPYEKGLKALQEKVN